MQKITSILSVCKHITAIIFLAAFVAQTFSKSFVMADYFTNTAKYAKNCINKAKPKLLCNGKCQMMKKLQQEEKKDQENPDRKNDNKYELPLSSKSFFACIDKTNYSVFSNSKFSLFTNNYAYNFTFSIYHPPKA